MNDCTNCLNRNRCFVKGGTGDFCKDVAKGYVHGEWENPPEHTNNNQQKGTDEMNTDTTTLELPAQSTVELWKSLTHDNAHNRARLEICKWLLIQFNEADGKNFRPPFGELLSIHRVLAAIETIAEDVGHMTSDLLEVRYNKTEQMIALVRRLNPEVADIITHSL